MGSNATQKLHWTQRVALVRHNLHASRRTNDFTFFKTLQAHALIDGTDHVAILHLVLGNEADQVLSTLDNLNAGIAYVHQDAFKAVYDGAKSTMYKANNSPSSRRSLIRVDICQQRDMADHAIDKTANSAIQLIQSQPVHCQDAIANAWITGTTIIADSVAVCLNEMENIEDSIDDFIRLEYAWNCIQNSVDAAISALRGIFSLMEQPNNPSPPEVLRNHSVSSAVGTDASGTFRSRTSSTASALGLIKRAFSHSQMQPPPVPKSSPAGSLPLLDTNPRGFRASMSAACPTRLPNYAEHQPTLLTTIPPTPNIYDTSVRDAGISPFEDNGDYFAFDMEKENNNLKKKAPSPSPSDSMQLEESLDPLYSPTNTEAAKTPVPLTLRRLSNAFGMSPSAAITV
ncbi:hypothetical protein P280DRAFT_27674 [Massarina eburnea CBS 473.64]|uniref:Uncharacterized protein n=1 Tax=Massarina eburnea CBS 473.64 TaxID=1395130 RepID=A0A6A6RYP5_9PLEO|nr:hypothetical protein P280DRAFT_27674 [Massarina eburnea CBS 473.64]